MPYIKQELRGPLHQWTFKSPKTPGELNYAITQVILDYLGADNEPLSYQKINDVIGALEGAKLEFYRRVAAPYEDKKCKDNGDVYIS